MNDFIDVEVTIERTEKGFRHTLKHNKRNITLAFDTPASIKAEALPDFFLELLKKYDAKYRKAIMKPLTPAQKNLYDILVKFHTDIGRAPTYYEMAEALGATNKGTPWQLVQKLLNKGWVWIDDGAVIPVDIARYEQLE